tara:strand:- start:661 stop:1530 length:870 start_codon:yes stop_codon:yes gene_type:complete
MRLIGGNISDTPVKEIGDGSAFSVGGGETGGQAAFLTSLGATDNQEIAWLPGFLSSYTAGSRMILNSVASPASGVAANVHTLHYGLDIHTATQFPTFTGTPGDESASEYLLFDGGDALTTADSTFMQSVNQNNAEFSVIFAFYLAAVGSVNASMFNSNTASYRSGIGITMNTDEKLVFQALNAGGVAAQAVHATAMTAGWHTCGLSIGEANNTGHIMLDGDSTSFASDYSSGLTSGARGILNIGCYGDDVTNNPIPNACRMGDIIMWNAEIGSTALNAASAVLETKYGI